MEHAYSRRRFPDQWWESPETIPRIARLLALGVKTPRTIAWGRNRMMAEMLAQAPRQWLQF